MFIEIDLVPYSNAYKITRTVRYGSTKSPLRLITLQHESLQPVTTSPDNLLLFLTLPRVKPHRSVL